VAHARTSSHLTYRDHFSRQAAAYAAYRPDYPDALFAYVAGLAPRHELAWDCATGSGQAALGLAPYFTRVLATDASAAQIAHALPHPRVEYLVAPAEASRLPAGTVDLITVAQALHWFDVDAFYAEARRVLAPGGVLAVWTYGNCVLDDPAVERVVHRYSHETVGPYWPAERRLVDDGYRTIPFPFREVAPPPFVLERVWTLAELTGYLRSWSATARYAAAHGRDPVTEIEPELGAAWGDPDTRRLVRWPLTVRAGSGE
jgi:SAM-dependent methyltransferase